MMKFQLVGPVAILMIILTAGSTVANAKICPDPNCKDPVSEEIRKIAEQLESEYSRMANETIYRDKTWLESCLDGINVFQGLGFSLSLPGLDDLMNKACQAATDEVNKRLESLKGKYSYSALGGIFEVEGSYSPGASSSMNVKDISGEVVSKIGNKINSALKL